MHRLRRYEVFEVCVQDDERSHEATAITREGLQMNTYKNLPDPFQSAKDWEDEALRRDPRVIQHEAGHAFYQWENATYGVSSTLSDDDRATWMQGYVYAYKQLKGLL
jgi:hypothetical protein